MQGYFEKYKTCEIGIPNQLDNLLLELIEMQQKINGLGSVILQKDPYYCFMASGRLIDCQYFPIPFEVGGV